MQVTINEAARRMNVSEHTVRRRVRSGELAGSQVATPQGYTWLVEVEEVAQPAAPANGELESLRELVEVLKAQTEADREERVRKDDQIRELHVLLQQVQAALPAPREEQRSWWRFWGR